MYIIYQLICFIFFGALLYFLLHYSTRYSLNLLWRNPPQQDAAATGAMKIRLDFHKLIDAETSSA
jgi:hypothetical protein